MVEENASFPEDPAELVVEAVNMNKSGAFPQRLHDGALEEGGADETTEWDVVEEELVITEEITHGQEVDDDFTNSMYQSAAGTMMSEASAMQDMASEMVAVAEEMTMPWEQADAQAIMGDAAAMSADASIMIADASLMGAMGASAPQDTTTQQVRSEMNIRQTRTSTPSPKQAPVMKQGR